MMWLVLLVACFRHKRVFVNQLDQDFIWTGTVKWVTPWTLAMNISYDDPDSVYAVYIPVYRIDNIRDFVPTPARDCVSDAYRDEPPATEGVKK